MTANYLERRIALVRLEAGLIRAGFSAHDNVAVRIADGEDPAVVKRALEAVCAASILPLNPQQSGGDVQPAPSNVVALEKLYDGCESPTHAVASAEVVDVPPSVLVVLENIRGLLPKEGTSWSHKRDVGWTLCVERGTGSKSGIVLRISTARAYKPQSKLAGLASALTNALDVPVRLESGMMSEAHADAWAHRSHTYVAPGMSIQGALVGLLAPGATVAVPVRFRQDRRDSAAARSEREYQFISAGHAFAEGISPASRADVRQPARNTNPDRVIGTVCRISYNGGYSAMNLIDSAVVESQSGVSLQFGRDSRFQINGIWTGEIMQNHQSYIYGASSGLIRVKVDYTSDTITTILSLSANQLVYRDMIEFSNDDDDVKPASAAGDSGAPLMVRVDGKFRLAGIVIGGGSKTAQTRKPRSYAVPIDRILRHFDIELY